MNKNIEKLYKAYASIIELRVETPLNNFFTLEEGTAGYSVAESIRLLSPINPKISLQGFKSIGKSVAYFLQDFQIGPIVGICEQEGYLYNPNGINVKKLLEAQKQSTNFYDSTNIFDDPKYQWIPRFRQESEERFLCRFLSHSNPDIFSPCAKKYSITKRVIDTLYSPSTQRFIICGANNAFASGQTREYALKKNIITIPEWITNSGNAILFMEALKFNGWNQDSPNKVLKTIRIYIEQFLKESQKQEPDILPLYEKCYLTAQSRLQKLS